MGEWLPVIGKTYERPWPFVRDTFEWFDEDGPTKLPTWKPGFNREPEYDAIWANAMGAELLTVVSTHKPSPRYPSRVFYIRQWRSPDGKVFGRTGLKQTVAWSFKNKLRQPEYLRWLEIDDSEHEADPGARAGKAVAV